MTERLKQKAMLEAMRLSGLRHLLGGVAGGRGAILTFHRIRPPNATDGFAPNAHLEVTPSFLAELVDWALERGIDVVTLDEAKRRLAEPAARFLVVTMDDGYRDNLEYALPVLKARGCPFTIYVATGFIDRTANPWWMVLETAIAGAASLRHPDGSGRTFDLTTPQGKVHAFSEIAAWLRAIPESEQRSVADRLAAEEGIDVAALVDDAFMDWDEVRRIAAEPLVTIGAHTHDHHALGRLSPEDAEADVMGGVERLETELGMRPRHFAYPYGFPGAVGPREHRMIAELGFSTAVLTSPGVLRPDDLTRPTAWPRISMNGHFQSVRWADVLISGVPFYPGHLARRMLGRGAAVMPAAAASSG